MALDGDGSHGWELRPLQSKASVSVATATLSATRVLEIAAKAGTGVEDDSGWLKVGERTAGQVEYVVKDLTRTEDRAALQFVVVVERSVGRVTARSAITRFEMRSGLSSLVPVARRKIVGFSVYRAFMDAFVDALHAEDPGCHVSFSGD
ncbi:hypothetical protein [Cellulomonas oligotrophica]|uniref:Uncharacterized protein n=1 Tax=Cellulomonas oligotrophica TaxID=931536 RepID=A0A7Y9FF28_9CELL|nr:hypothetical protein [Cellulomonas oligotrophica]NYD84841.1 hypothetical protein [Cellulomonas oligotrophica]GIG31910.1 hypothetical protein Col01nite_10690 [Cellulomonas oligotrophica]